MANTACKLHLTESTLEMSYTNIVPFPEVGMANEEKEDFVAECTQDYLCYSCMNPLRYGKWHGQCTCGKYRFVDPWSSMVQIPLKKPGPGTLGASKRDQLGKSRAETLVAPHPTTSSFSSAAAGTPPLFSSEMWSTEGTSTSSTGSWTSVSSSQEALNGKEEIQSQDKDKSRMPLHCQEEIQSQDVDKSLKTLDGLEKITLQDENKSVLKMLMSRSFAMLLAVMLTLKMGIGKLFAWTVRPMFRFGLNLIKKTFYFALLVIVACVLESLLIGSKRLLMATLRIKINI